MALLSAKQLAAELGFTVGQIQKLARRGDLPALRFGSEWRFSLDEVLAARRYRNQSRDAIRQNAEEAARQASWRGRQTRRIA